MISLRTQCALCLFLPVSSGLFLSFISLLLSRYLFYLYDSAQSLLFSLFVSPLPSCHFCSLPHFCLPSSLPFSASVSLSIFVSRFLISVSLSVSLLFFLSVCPYLFISPFLFVCRRSIHLVSNHFVSVYFVR